MSWLQTLRNGRVVAEGESDTRRRRYPGHRLRVPVDPIKQEVRAYLRRQAGAGCPPEFRHFDPTHASKHGVGNGVSNKTLILWAEGELGRGLTNEEVWEFVRTQVPLDAPEDCGSLVA